MIEYEAIKAAYSDRKAERSKLPYLRHIDQGILLLKRLQASEDVLKAWCLHPIFQLDEFYVPLMRGNSGAAFKTSPKVVALAMEYRAVANAFLTDDEPYFVSKKVADGEQTSSSRPKISRVADVNKMLIVDKVQNWRDARLHLYPHVPKKEQEHLDRYFSKWLVALEVTPKDRALLEDLLSENDLQTKL